MQPDQTPEVPGPTFGTEPGIPSINGIYAYDCGDETDHKSLKGDCLDGAEPDEDWWHGCADIQEQP